MRIPRYLPRNILVSGLEDSDEDGTNKKIERLRKKIYESEQ